MGNACPDHAFADVQGCGAADQNGSERGNPSGRSATEQRYKLPVEI